MASHRNEKINGQIQRELSLIIIHKMKDTRIRDSNVSITRVRATPDLKTATVYVSIFGDEAQKKAVVELLNNAKSFLRSSLGKVITVHSVPALIFEIDDSVEYGMHIESILKSLKDDKEIKVDQELKEDNEENS
ncbi:30S ribosome-binding factor RbfA [Acetobacterium paludosum]|uniref:Ribosome-binding factor A n=1 Tax=Acetobacterium paludosum TaxID=52693 RepID=A0A923HXE2_9FIRM|nr:30S ribosome-binding factor RbfA [Acetobacterium paludosum]MBC3888925.1 30S ribosome-binding factor RbfA [Acetobacterium paludosum]